MKFFSKIILYISFFSIFCICVFAQANSGGVKGKVRNAKGDGIAEVSVTARKNGKDVKKATTDAGGEFVLSGLETGNYNLVFGRDGYSSGTLYNVEVKKNKIRDVGGKLILTIDRGTQVIIVGTVFDENGRSIAGAKIDIEKILSDGSTKKFDSIYTSSGGDVSARGEFTFRFPQGAAKFRVTASVKDVSASKEIEVSSAAIYRLAITLKVGGKP